MVYKEETAKKEEEESQMSAVLKDYKSKFADFDKNMKQSKKTLSEYEKEIARMNRTIN